MLQLGLVAGFRILFCQYTLRVFQLPFVRKQIQKFLAGRLLVIGHSGDDVIQVIPGIHVVCLASCQQGTDHRHIGRRLVVAAEEIILASQRDGPDNIFRQVVVPKQASVFQASHHVAPSGVGIRDSFAGLRPGTVPDAFRFHPCLHGSRARAGPRSFFRFCRFCLFLSM